MLQPGQVGAYAGDPGQAHHAARTGMRARRTAYTGMHCWQACAAAQREQDCVIMRIEFDWTDTRFQ